MKRIITILSLTMLSTMFFSCDPISDDPEAIKPISIKPISKEVDAQRLMKKLYRPDKGWWGDFVANGYKNF